MTVANARNIRELREGESDWMTQKQAIAREDNREYKMEKKTEREIKMQSTLCCRLGLPCCRNVGVHRFNNVLV